MVKLKKNVMNGRAEGKCLAYSKSYPTRYFKVKNQAPPKKLQ